MSRPLNPGLFESLQQRFGQVNFSNEGEAFVGSYIEDRLTGGKPILQVEWPGEHYLVNCPFCKDTRHRLQINHTWGIKDEQDNLRLHFSCCFNEGCLVDMSNRMELFHTMTELGATVRKRGHKTILQGKVLPPEARVVRMPGACTRIDKLPANHHSVVYLRSRHYDVERLGRVYGVSYCHQSEYYLAQDRIIIPMKVGGTLRHWQARYIGEPPSKQIPKYWGCPHVKRGQLLYNIDMASRYKTIVVVEGATDVWGFGPMTVAQFSKAMTMHQRALLSKYARDCSIVLLNDPGAAEKAAAEKTFNALKTKFASTGIAQVDLTHGDPGELDRGFMRTFVREEAKAQGVNVSFKKRV